MGPLHLRESGIHGADDDTSLRDVGAGRWQAQAREVLRLESQALAELAGKVDEAFARAVRVLLRTDGHVVVLGIGKSGLVGRKMAATFASTGTPSFFVHATEALHGDLGTLTDGDTALLVSYSGGTEEVVRLVPHLRQRGIPTVAMVGDVRSPLARAVDVALDVSVSSEVCPNNLAPTSSSLATLAMGDALAVVLMRERRFRSEDFARFHPGGRLGRRLALRVEDVMRASDLPLVTQHASVRECLFAIAAGRAGLAIVVDAQRHPVGLLTHADLDAALGRDPASLERSIDPWVRRSHATVAAGATLGHAERILAESSERCLVAVDANGRVVGLLEASAI